MAKYKITKAGAAALNLPEGTIKEVSTTPLASFWEEIKPQYWLVSAGLRKVTYTNNPVFTAEEACEDAYGFFHPDFKCYPIGEVKPSISAVAYAMKHGKEILKSLKNN